jgi:glycine oxidase
LPHAGSEPWDASCDEIVSKFSRENKDCGAWVLLVAWKANLPKLNSPVADDRLVNYPDRMSGKRPNHAGSAGIAGAGLAGRLLALELVERGWEVTLFDSDDKNGSSSCAHTGAGMLAPHSELETAEPEIRDLGIESLALWPEILHRLAIPVPFHATGTLLVAHPADEGELIRIENRIRDKSGDHDVLEHIDGRRISALEPELAGRFQHGLFLAGEGHLDNRALLISLAATLEKLGVEWLPGCPAIEVKAGSIRLEDRTRTFDCVFDCRGYGAKAELPDLRGVRGELIYLSAPDVGLLRPVRIMHPRYPLYIVPREEHIFVVGATTVESEDRGPITVRSALELLSAAYAVHPGFGEARIVETCVNLRPAFPDHCPRISCEKGLVRINGLYRHGFLVSPALVQQALDMVSWKYELTETSPS